MLLGMPIFAFAQKPYNRTILLIVNGALIAMGPLNGVIFMPLTLKLEHVDFGGSYRLIQQYFGFAEI